MDLESIYRQTLARCAPDRLVRKAVPGDVPRHVVAIGKCAGAMLDGVAAEIDVERALAIIPHAYPAPKSPAGVLSGGHPEMDQASFAAGRELIAFVEGHDEILFLISGGGSACVEAPLEPWFHREDLIAVNARLIAAGLPIAQINTVRKHLSSIKGGRLAARVKRRSVTLLYSDVSTGDLASIASGPTLPDITTNRDAAAILERVGGFDRIVKALQDVPDTVKQISNATASLVADNATLTRAAAGVIPTPSAREGEESGRAGVILIPTQIEDDVERAALFLAARAGALRTGEVLIAGGEPTVMKRGAGRGGRCSELAVRFALHYRGSEVSALFGSSDGIDGSSGFAGVVLDRVPIPIDRFAAAAALADSDTGPFAQHIGRPIMIAPTGNNLRDLYLVAR